MHDYLQRSRNPTQNFVHPTRGTRGTREILTLSNSQFPIPNSQFPIPNSQFPIPNSQFPIPKQNIPIVGCFSAA
ncbi:MAG: hypothetical protein F6K41_03955 [Symploca sp. SIO3E6]|nr:hypothetical protein [Caldora sp. SIO3E6]